MNKIMLVILVFAVFTVPAAAHEVYLVPQQSNAAYRSTADVEIWVGWKGSHHRVPFHFKYGRFTPSSTLTAMKWL